MKTNPVKTLKIAALAAAIALVPMGAQAHRAWLLPSATVLSGENAWVTIDAASSNDLFYFEHQPMRLRDGDLVVTAPDGTAAEVQNQAQGRFRTTFDVELKQAGTYRIAVATDGLFGRYKLNGEAKRWRGSAATLGEIPAEATEVEITETQRRLETFVTKGAPTELKPSGKGLELLPVTHPNDLVAGEEATFKLVLDGKPAADVEVELVRGGIRYRNALGEQKLKTDADGVLKVTWGEPGMYWLEASVADDAVSTDKAKERRATYVATFEVLPQ
ncbi:DUF4198 domain-containing protein [Zavarzinia sp. CC-PAN008]|uniref:DUF4198 domain-containing protein n=1 Tax=Zavarzinia sp. CC-PAN008 TaxID=3243332 RepID=UPI003F7420F5